jgi:hypothetical protein
MTNETSTWSDETIPYICWDRDWSVAEIRSRLLSSEGVEKHRLMAWLMRELKTPEVWFFLKPTDIGEEFVGISRWLGPARPLWEYLLGIWHELGKL